MDNYNGYKLKPKEYSIQPNDVIIRVKGRMSFITNGQIALALGDNQISTYLHNTWTTSYSDWRAIETKPGQKAVAGDTAYCIRNTGSDCNQHDSFRVTGHPNRNYISPEKGHKLLNGTITGQGWNWKAIDFVVLVKADAKELQEFPCYRKGIVERHVVKFISPEGGTIVFTGKSQFDLGHASNNWVDYNNTSVWEPCNDPREIEEVTPVVVDPYKAKQGDYVEWANNSTPTSMTKGQLYKVLKVLSPTALSILNNCNKEDVWLKERFKRVPDKAIQDPVLISSDDHIDALSYALRIPISYISIDSMMHKPTPVDTATISIVPVDSMMNKPTQPKQKSKGKQMNSNLFTDILKLLMQTEQTDLEKAPSTYAFFYNNEGEYEGTARVANEAEAKALLQKPEHLGYTMRIYTFSDEFTTQIPVVSTIKKTVVDKPARKTRVSKVK